MRFFHTETKLAEFLLQASILHKPRESESPQSGMPIPQRAKPNNHHATEPAIRRRRGDANRNRPQPQAGSSGAGKAKAQRGRRLPPRTEAYHEAPLPLPAAG